METNEPRSSSLYARLYHFILFSFRRAISKTADVEHLSLKVRHCGQRFKLWAASLYVENGNLDIQLEEDEEMGDSVLLLLGLILYDLYKISILASNSEIQHGKDTTNLSQPFNPRKTFIDFESNLTEPMGNLQVEDYAPWFSSLIYLCPSLQSFIPDSDLGATDDLELLYNNSEDTITNFIEDMEDSVQQLYDLAPSLSWEIQLPSAETDAWGERQEFADENDLWDGALHYHDLIQGKYTHIDQSLAARLAKANWWRFRRLETSRELASSYRSSLARQTHLGSELYTVKVQNDKAQAEALEEESEDASTEYGSVDISMDRSDTSGRLKFPAPPMEELGLDRGKFICTVCGSLVGPFQDKREWSSHVVRDLAPYTCPFPLCDLEQVDFDSQRSFTTHLRFFHSSPSLCRCKFPNCDVLIHDPEAFEQHVRELHGIIEAEDCKQLYDAWTEKTTIFEKNDPCPICQSVIERDLIQQSKHLCRHMLDIALLSIPNHSMDSDDSDEYAMSDDTVNLIDSTIDTMAGSSVVKPDFPTQPSIADRDGSIDVEETGMKDSLRDESNDPINKQENKRSVENLKVSVPIRPINKIEALAIQNFDKHARTCPYCQSELDYHFNQRELCEKGHEIGQDVCKLLYENVDGYTFSHEMHEGHPVRVQIPKKYTKTRSLLRAVKRNNRHERKQAVVDMDRDNISDFLKPPTESRPIEAKEISKGKDRGRRRRAGGYVDVMRSESKEKEKKKRINRPRLGVNMKLPDRREESPKHSSGGEHAAMNTHEPSAREV